MSKKFLGLNSIDSIKNYVNKQIGAAINGEFVPPTNPDTPEIIQWNIGDDGYWYANGEKTEYRAIGEQGPQGPAGEQGLPGLPGENGVTTFKSIVFKRSNEDISNEQPTGGDWDDPIADGWEDSIPDGVGIIWMTTRTFYSLDSMNENESWSLPKIMQDSNSFNVAYGTSAVVQEDGTYDFSGLPTKDDYADPSGEFVAPWYDDAELIPEGEEIWFMATAINNNGQWSKWVVSKIKGENGSNGTSINIKDTFESLDAFKTRFGEALNVAPDNVADCYLVKFDDGTEHMFVWVSGLGEWIDQGPFSGIPGADGVSQFLHIKYAKSVGEVDEFNQPINCESIELTDKNGEDPSGAYWIGICKTNSTDNPDGDDPIPNDVVEGKQYKWTKIFVDPIMTPARFKSIVFVRSPDDLSTITPTGGTWDIPKPIDTESIKWSDGIPEGNEGVIWSTWREFSSDEDFTDQSKIIWVAPIQMIDTPGFATAYATEDALVDGVVDTNGLPWDENNEYANPDGSYNEPWVDEPETGVDYYYMATTDKSGGLWSPWRIFKIKGERGDKGSSVKISVTFNDLNELIEYYSDGTNGVAGEPIDVYKDNAHIIKNGPVVDGSDPVEYQWHNHLFVWVGTNVVDSYNGWFDAGKFNGDDGKDGIDGTNGLSAYVHIKYAKKIVFDVDGKCIINDCETTDKFGESTMDALWIGMCNDNNELDPTLNPDDEKYSDDNWNKYKWSEMVPESLVNDRVRTTFGTYHISSNHIAGKTIDTAVDNNGNNNYVDLIAGTEYVTFTKDDDGNEVQNDPTEAIEGDKGPAWQLRTDGAGYLAKGNIRWDGNGDVTFGPDVKIAWDSENWDSKIPAVPTSGDIADIAATTITDEFLATKNIYAKGIQGNVISGHTIQSSETTNGEPNWKIDNAGVGYFAKGNFEWDAHGNVTLGGLNKDGTRPIITIADAWKTDENGNIFAKNEMAKFANDGSGYIGKENEGLSWDIKGNVTINSQLKYNFQAIYIGSDERPEGLKISDVNKYLIKDGTASRIIDTTNEIKSINIDWWNSDILKDAKLTNRLIDIDIINGTANTIAVKGTSNNYKNTIIYAPFRKSHNYVFPQNNFTLGEISNQSSTTTNQIYLLPGTTLELQLYNLEGEDDVIGYVKNIGSFQLVSGADSSNASTINVLCSMAPEHNNVPINNVDIDSIENDRQHAQFTISHEFTAYNDDNIDDMMLLCKQNNLNIPLLKDNTYISAHYDTFNKKDAIYLHNELFNNTCINLFNENLNVLNYDSISKLNTSKFTGYSSLIFNWGGMFDVTQAQLSFVKSYGLDIATIKNNDFKIPYLLKLNYYIPEYNKRFKSKPIRLFDLPDASTCYFEFDNNDINMLLSTLFNSSNKRLNIYDFIECKHVINVECIQDWVLKNIDSVSIAKEGTAGKPIELIIDFNEKQFNYGTNMVKPSVDCTWINIGQPIEQDNKYIYELTIYPNDSGETRKANIEMECQCYDINDEVQTYKRYFEVTQSA